jgi:hypothetical protein
MVPGRSTIYPRGKLTGGSSAINGALAAARELASLTERAARALVGAGWLGA